MTETDTTDHLRIIADQSKLIQRLVDDVAILRVSFAMVAGYETVSGEDGLKEAAEYGYQPTP